jgi:hypothetical protein
MRIRVCIAVGDPHAEWNLSPGKKMLQCISQGDITQRRISEAPAAFCGACALRTKCTTSKRG